VYDDPGVAPGQPKADELAAALRKTGLAILTTDKGDPRTGGAFERTGYVAVFAVKDVEFDERGLRFEFVKRLVDLA
jgi:signal recognition particle subunit SEC65